MQQFFLLPGAPFYAAAVAFALLAFAGVLLMDRQRVAVVGYQTAPTSLSMSRRLLIGQLVAAPIAAMLLLLVVVTNMSGNARLLVLVGALLIYLYAGLVVPRKPIVERQKQQRQIRALTPPFINFLKVALGSFESPSDVMKRYTERQSTKLRPMQEVVQSALDLKDRDRLRPFSALATVARGSGCRELIDVSDILAQAESEGGEFQSVLEAQQQTLEAILQDEFKRMLRKREMYILLLSAISLVVGILINLLFVMTGGGTVLGSL